MIKGIIFDMDGLLIDTEKYYFRYWIESAEEFGFSMKPRHALAIRSLSSKYAESYLKKVLGDKFNYNEVRKRRRELIHDAIEKYGIKVKPGAAELLEFCKNKGIFTAVATATSAENAKHYLEKVGLAHMFSEIVGGDSVKKGKPAPDIYLKAAECMGLSSEACLALEDSPNGIISAFSAGCRPIMIPDLTEPDEMLKPFLYDCVPALTHVIDILIRDIGG